MGGSFKKCLLTPDTQRHDHGAGRRDTHKNALDFLGSQGHKQQHARMVHVAWIKRPAVASSQLFYSGTSGIHIENHVVQLGIAQFGNQLQIEWRLIADGKA